MLRKPRKTVEVYRAMWGIVFEMWMVNEEKQQFNWDVEYKHEVEEELAVFEKLRGLFMRKFEYANKLAKKRLETSLFERDFVEFSKDPELLSRLQKEVLKNPDSAPKTASAPKT